MNLSIFVVIVFLVHVGLGQNNTDANITTSNESEPELMPINSRKLMISTDRDKSTVASLTKYHFKLREDCLFDLNKYYRLDSTNMQHEETELTKDLYPNYCPTTADFLYCFPTTPVNKTIRFACPFKKGFVVESKDVFASRECKADGFWGYTNYSLCLKKIVELMKSNDGDETALYQMMANLNLAGFSVTIFSVSLAIFIFISFRSLRCLRNMIHCNMLATFVLKCSTYIAFYVFVLSENVKISDQNHFMCVLFNIFWNYSLLASFFWNMIEAVYLITVIVATYSSNKIKLWWYLLIGWVLPMVPIIPYSILTYQSTNTTCSWINSDYHSVNENFIDIPIYIVLLINFILLVIILYVIINKLRNHNDTVKPKYEQYKKLTRATMVLFPLFGLTFAVFFWHPSDKKTLFSKIYYAISIFLQTSQGIWVSFVYCFLNDEVKNALKNKFRSWKISYFGQCFFSLNRNPSHTTATYNTQTQATTVVNHRQRPETTGNDPTCVPMLPVAEERIEQKN